MDNDNNSCQSESKHKHDKQGEDQESNKDGVRTVRQSQEELAQFLMAQAQAEQEKV